MYGFVRLLYPFLGYPQILPPAFKNLSTVTLAAGGKIRLLGNLFTIFYKLNVFSLLHLGPLTPLVDLNVLGSTSDYDEKRCMLINSRSGVSGRAVVGLTNRHYVKAVGINTRNDEMSS